MIRTKHIFLHFVFILHCEAMTPTFQYIPSSIDDQAKYLSLLLIRSFFIVPTLSVGVGANETWLNFEFVVVRKIWMLLLKFVCILIEQLLKGPFCLHILYTLSLNTRCAHRVIVVKHQMTFQTLHSVSYGTYRPVMFATYMQKPQM